MPKGITQEQVNAAADALVTAGEKPTVEKIRLALGTGSPNTVIRMLDTWRGSLAQRLQEVIKLPDVPPEAGQAFAEVWRVAVAHAETLARATVMEDQNALFAAQTSLTQERKLWEIALAEAQGNVADVSSQLKSIELQLSERHGLLAQTESQRLDLLKQRDRLQQQHDQLAEELALARVQLLATESKASSEREQTNIHIRHVEDRASSEVDRARQEIKALQQRLGASQRDHNNTVKRLSAERDAYLSTLRSVEQQLATERGRAEVLQQQLSQKPHTKDKLKAARKKKETAPISTSSRTQRQSRRSEQ